MSEKRIREVMDLFGFDYIQARNHVKCQLILQDSGRYVTAARMPSLIGPVEDVVTAPGPQSENTIK